MNGPQKNIENFVLHYFYQLGLIPFGILGQVWYLIVSISDLCSLTYFSLNVKIITIFNMSNEDIIIDARMVSHFIPLYVPNETKLMINSNVNKITN